MEFFINKGEDGSASAKQILSRWDALKIGRYRIRIDEYSKRSLPQNAYYWSTVVPLVYTALRDSGFDAVRNHDDAHEVMKHLFLKVSEQRGEVLIERVISTTELTKMEFSEYIEHITLWAWDYLQVTIPAPGQQLEVF